jgi:hypothetical protein
MEFFFHFPPFFSPSIGFCINPSKNQFVFISILVIILFIIICFAFEAFLDWFFFFNFIHQHLISFNFYIKFGLYFFISIFFLFFNQLLIIFFNFITQKFISFDFYIQFHPHSFYFFNHFLDLFFFQFHPSIFYFI